MKLILHQLPKRCKSLIPLLAAPAALLLSQGQAKAILTYNIFESGGTVVAQTSSSLNLIGATQIGRQGCSFSSLIASTFAIICSAPASAAPGSTGVAFNQLWHHRTYCIQRNRFYWPRIQRLDALMR